jgi:hypothetical protein
MRLSLHAAVLAAACLGLPPAARAQSAVRFTLPFGPHAVGFRTVDQYDHSRGFGDGFDDYGRPRTGERARPIPTSIWYPSAGSRAARMRYREYLELNAAPGAFPVSDEAGRRAAVQALVGVFGAADTARLRREMDAATHAWRDAGPAAGRFPVIIYGPSLGAPAFENATLMEYLASYGYIVISSPSLGATGGMTVDVEGMESQARDMEFLMAFARTVPGADVGRVGVMGFSWGGISNVLMSLRNPGIGALVAWTAPSRTTTTPCSRGRRSPPARG